MRIRPRAQTTSFSPTAPFRRGDITSVRSRGQSVYGGLQPPPAHKTTYPATQACWPVNCAPVLGGQIVPGRRFGNVWGTTTCRGRLATDSQDGQTTRLVKHKQRRTISTWIVTTVNTYSPIKVRQGGASGDKPPQKF